jgi:hypothetical protein
MVLPVSIQTHFTSEYLHRILGVLASLQPPNGDTSSETHAALRASTRAPESTVGLMSGARCRPGGSQHASGHRCSHPASNLPARPPRHATCCTMRPLLTMTVELRPCGATQGHERGCVVAALPSHGRSHRFDPCHAHHTKPQVTPPGFTPRCCLKTRHGSAGPRWGRGSSPAGR